MNELIIKGWKTSEGRVVIMGVAGPVFNTLTQHLLEGVSIETIPDNEIPSPVELFDHSTKHADEPCWYVIHFDPSFDVVEKLAKYPVWESGVNSRPSIHQAIGQSINPFI